MFSGNSKKSSMMCLNDNPWISSSNQPALSTVLQLSFKIRSIVSFTLHGHQKLIIMLCIFF